MDSAMVIAFVMTILSVFTKSFKSLHELSGYILLFLIALHFLLHVKMFWNWIKNVFSGNE